jgi:hypothetical protein
VDGDPLKGILSIIMINKRVRRAGQRSECLSETSGRLAVGMAATGSLVHDSSEAKMAMQKWY